MTGFAGLSRASRMRSEISVIRAPDPFQRVVPPGPSRRDFVPRLRRQLPLVVDGSLRLREYWRTGDTSRAGRLCRHTVVHRLSLLVSLRKRLAFGSPLTEGR